MTVNSSSGGKIDLFKGIKNRYKKITSKKPKKDIGTGGSLEDSAMFLMDKKRKGRQENWNEEADFTTEMGIRERAMQRRAEREKKKGKK